MLRTLRLNLSFLYHLLRNYFLVIRKATRLLFKRKLRGYLFYPEEILAPMLGLYDSDLRIKFRNRYASYQKMITNLKKKQPIRVGLLIHDLAVFTLEPLIALMEKEPNYDFKILLCPHSSIESYSMLVNHFQKKNIHAELLYSIERKSYRDLSDIGLDLLIYTNLNFENTQYKPQQAGKYLLPLYIPYGYKIAANKNLIWKFQNFQFNKLEQHYCWLNLLENKHMMDQKKKYSMIGAENSVVIGFPRLDRYYEILNKNKPIDPEVKLLKTNSKMVIWAPHFSTLSKIPLYNLSTSALFSSFEWNFQFFLKLFKKYTQINWVIRLHPLFKKDRYRDYFLALEKLPNVAFYNEEAFIDLFIESDAMITDSISFLTDYIPSKKPLLFLKGPYYKFNEKGKMLVSNHYQCSGRNHRRIEKFVINTVLNEKDKMLNKRIKNLNDFINIKDSCQSQKIIDLLNSTFDKNNVNSSLLNSVSYK